jgi:hypothetical protein
MTNHGATCSKSTILCGQLYEALHRKIPDLKIKNGSEWCSIWSTGVVIAWISHTTIRAGIRVWFLGNWETLKEFSALAGVPKITPIAGAWGDYCGSLKISNDAQLTEAVELLFAIYSNEAGAFKAQWKPAGRDQNVKVNGSVPSTYTTSMGRQF